MDIDLQSCGIMRNNPQSYDIMRTYPCLTDTSDEIFYSKCSGLICCCSAGRYSSMCQFSSETFNKTDSECFFIRFLCVLISRILLVTNKICCMKEANRYATV